LSVTDERAEARVKALLHARLGGSGLERDACILDISSEGLLVSAAMPPRPTQKVTVRANGYTMTGEVRWVEDRRFGISLTAPILVDDVIEAKVLRPGPRVATTSLPENFGIRKEEQPAVLTVLNALESKWLRYGLIIAIGSGIAIYVGMHAGHHASTMAEQLAAAHETSQAEHKALNN
jgi:PilZ domain